MSSESPPTLEREECTKLLDSLLANSSTAKKKLKAVRNHCMAVLMLDAGLRVGELVSLRLSDLFFNNLPVRTIFIKSHITKNKVEHSIPVSDRLSKSLASYRDTLTFSVTDFSAAFAFASATLDVPVTTRQVERIIGAAGWKALGRPVHPHVLRHTFASRLMRVTNSSTVQGMLGHKYLSSTQIYCHPNEDDKRQAIEKATLEPVLDHSAEQTASDSDLPLLQDRSGPLPASPSRSPQGSRW